MLRTKTWGSVEMKFLVWLGCGALLGFVFMLILAATVRAAEPAKDLPTLKTWVHIFGCPRPRNDVVLIFVDGTQAHIVVDKLSDDEKAALSKFVGETTGLNIKYECGTSA
jgi:hypothetical protein